MAEAKLNTFLGHSILNIIPLTVYTRTSRLRLTPAEAQRYTPSKGVNLKWHKWNKDYTEVIAEFLAADTYAMPNEAQTKELIDYEIDYKLSSRIIKGNIPNPKNVVTSVVSKFPVDHPLLKLNLPKSKADDFKKVERMEIPNTALMQANKNIIKLAQLDKRLRTNGLADKRIKPLKKKTHSSIVELATLEDRF